MDDPNNSKPVISDPFVYMYALARAYGMENFHVLIPSYIPLDFWRSTVYLPEIAKENVLT